MSGPVYPSDLSYAWARPSRATMPKLGGNGAERRMGELLSVSERAKGAPGPGRGKAGNEAGPAFTDAPTLTDLGLTKNSGPAANDTAKR